MKTLTKLLQGIAVAATVAPMAAHSQDLRVLSSWSESYAPVTEVLDPFLEKLEEESGGSMTLTRFGPETVPPFEQLDPVSRGLFDMLFTNGAYHYNDTAVGMSLDALDGTASDLREAGVWDFVDQHYQDRGLKLIAVLYDLNGYHIMLKEPLGDDALSGRRIRGTPIYHPVIEALGGSPVVLPGSEIYPALERGVVDGAAWPTVGAVGFRWFEVADHMIRPSFGQVGHPVFMSLDTWNSLDASTQETIARAAEAYEAEAVENFNQVVSEEEAVLAEEGMTVTELADSYAEQLNEAWYSGVMELAAEQSSEAIATLREMAREAGLAP
ncbi:TRAP transporter substrate-binding protein DctP [Tranquillimonas alkanivorans]|uniref:TRAP-type C4-dicarboxylate transport system, substrate-binding protein n=1 Tax=Tranquillimonas alkanivorans TaxID=441119 RepID=A0A1I5U6V1_9RHOB|nr:TRAP transporter substrate-binding protein DctP [Tranquillimonas alkanivorans]SFP90988.1 TRAP-type C4-dicarboxylate transport system, substrate-binding protein [Tranquillimonas alkanivorans]